MALLTMPQCFFCAHLGERGLTCKAFPNGIPDAILTGEHDHRQPYKNDHGLRFQQSEYRPELYPTDETA